VIGATAQHHLGLVGFINVASVKKPIGKRCVMSHERLQVNGADRSLSGRFAGRSIAMDQAKNILDNHDVASAKDLLEWRPDRRDGCGRRARRLRVTEVAAGRSVEATEKVVQDGREVVRVHIQGDRHSVVFVHPQALDASPR
jgi:hypothetical protein